MIFAALTAPLALAQIFFPTLILFLPFSFLLAVKHRTLGIPFGFLNGVFFDLVEGYRLGTTALALFGSLLLVSLCVRFINAHRIAGVFTVLCIFEVVFFLGFFLISAGVLGQAPTVAAFNPDVFSLRLLQNVLFGLGITLLAHLATNV